MIEKMAADIHGLPFAHRDAVKEHLLAIAAALRRHGEISFGAYMARLDLLAYLVSSVAQTPSWARSEKIWAWTDSCREDVYRQFEHMALMNTVVCPPNMIGDETRPLYQQVLHKSPDTIVPPSRLTTPLLPITSATARRLEMSRFYLYCIDHAGDGILYARPMRIQDMLNGIYEGDLPVKHPTLVFERGGPVRSAGEIMFIPGFGGTIAAVIATRASGHYRPGPEARRNVIDFAAERLGITDPRLVIAI